MTDLPRLQPSFRRPHFGARRELTTPVPFESPEPVVDSSKALRVRAIGNPPTVAPRTDQADHPEYSEMFRNRRLGQAERDHDLRDHPFATREIDQNISTPSLRNGIERVRRRGGSRRRSGYWM